MRCVKRHNFMLDKYIYEIALNKIPSVGPVLAKLLMSYCGGAQGVFAEKKSQLLRIPHIGDKIAAHILAADPETLAQTELHFIEKNNIVVLSYRDEGYPQRLLEYDDAPLLLYYKGKADLNAARTIAIIGTRKPSEYGKTQTEKLIHDLKVFNPLIVSGLAYGIDTKAHQVALTEDLATVGVLGHGLDRLYPAQNKRLARDMLNSQGGLLTEFTSGTKPDAVNFPMRNRIIAALSDVIVVMESAQSGGSIITAELANSYHKDVFAFPGKITDTYSQGCNKLIKQHKASLIESATDIAYIMRWDTGKTEQTIQPKLFLDLQPEEQLIYDYLKEKTEEQFDNLHASIDLSIGQLSSLLLTMEFSGIVKSLPGKRYMLIT